jgi:hypothetical protein
VERFAVHGSKPLALSWATVVTTAAKLDGARREVVADVRPDMRAPAEYALPAHREAFCPSRSERLSYAGGGKPNPPRKPLPEPVYNRVVDTLNALEAHPYVIEHADGSFRLFRDGRSAHRCLQFTKGAKLYFVCMIYRTVGVASARLPSSDKRDPRHSAKRLGNKMHVAGEGTKIVTHKVPVKLSVRQIG